MTDINPYEAGAPTGDQGSFNAIDTSGRPSTSARILRGCVLAATVTITMLISLSASFSDGLFDAFTSGFLFSGGIVASMQGGVIHILLINLFGALTVCFLVPRLIDDPNQMPVWGVALLTHLFAYFAATYIDTQQLVKAAMVTGQGPYVTTTSVFASVSVWIVAYLLAIESIKFFPRTQG